MTTRSDGSDRSDASTAEAPTAQTDGTERSTVPIGETDPTEPTASVSRRRLLGVAGATAATAGLAGCSGILGGDGDGGSGNGMDNVENEVEGIEITDAVSQSNEGRYSILVTLRNTGGEDTSVLDFDYDVTLYDSSGSEIEMMGTGAANRDGFFDGNPGKVEIVPQTTADAATVDRFELVVRCDDGPYCQ